MLLVAASPPVDFDLFLLPFGLPLGRLACPSCTMLLDEGSLFPAPRLAVVVFAEGLAVAPLTGDWGVLPFKRRSVRYLKNGLLRDIGD